MANPQPDRFTRISNELYEAIMHTDFSKRQRNILDLVVRMSFGCGKKFAILRPSDFEVVGVYKTHIKKELEYLASANVIVINGETITLNKNYDQWRVSIVKSFDKEKLQDILRRNLSPDSVTKTVTEVTKTVTEDQSSSYQNSNQEVTETVTHGYQNSNSEVTKTVTGTPSDACVGAEREPSKDILKKIKENKESSSSNMADQSIGQLYQLFHQHFRGVNSTQDQKLSSYLDDGMEPKLLEKAILIAREKGKDVGYFWGILNRWFDKGITTLEMYEDSEAEWKRGREQGGEYEHNARGHPKASGEDEGTGQGYFRSFGIGKRVSQWE
jgi:DnaD/phage-associated family protein